MERIIGITLFALGALGFIASFSALIAGAASAPIGGAGLVVGGAVGLAASISAMSLGIFLTKGSKSWW